jgi:hypothetical protein
MSRKDFYEFMEVFLKGLNLFKIQIGFASEFYNQNTKRFGSWEKRKFYLAKFGDFWR